MKQPWKDRNQPIEQRVQDLMKRLTLEEKISQLLHDSPAVERLEIPAYNWWNECLHGIARAGRATVFPQAIALAATFNETLVLEAAEVMAEEGRAKYEIAARRGNRSQYRGLTFWSPNVNIFRDPRWGRGQETFGEDPYLSGLLGNAVVKGLQQIKDGIMKAAACAKHFAVHSGPEKLRHEFNALVSMQDLRATYLPAFKKLVTESGVEAVMGAYNRINGEPCCASSLLLQEILRNEWGFSGHVVSDCWAVRDFHTGHKVTQTPAQSAALAIRSGCDLNCGCSYSFALQALEEGLLTEQDIDKSLKRVLTTRFKLGLLDEPGTGPWSRTDAASIDSQAHRETARRAAEESFVLLKNNGVLPLSEDITSVYLIGPNASNPQSLYGNYYGLNPRMVTFLEGFTEAVAEGARIDYRPGTLLVGKKPNPVDWAIFESETAEVTIAFMGLDNSLEGEEGDAVASAELGDRTRIELPEGQLEFLKKLRQRCRKLIIVLSTGSALAVDEAYALCDAMITAWYPGEEGGTALASVLFGKTAPSGALPVTWYRSTEDLPPYEDYSMKGRTYRYFEGEVLFPFGFGLSYTSFEYSNITLTKSEIQRGASTHASVSVKNTGSRNGRVICQCYLIPPKTDQGYPLQELKGIRKVFIQPGETVQVQFDLHADDFTHYNLDGTATIPSGEWEIVIGSCSPSPAADKLGAPEHVSKTITIL